MGNEHSTTIGVPLTDIAAVEAVTSGWRRTKSDLNFTGSLKQH
jgi:hypothetical protein